MEHEGGSRRELLQLGMAAAAAWACQGCRLVGSRKPDAVAQQTDGRMRLSADESSKLLQSEGSLLVRPDDASDKVLLVRDRDGGLHAVSATCTHMGCDVLFDKNLGHIRCPCHGSEFGLDGRNIKGPASRPLKSYAIQTQDGRIVVTGLSPAKS